MRQSKSRSRSKNNRNRPQQGNVVNRVFDSSGPEGKVRGTPQQIIDKYNQLARDAFLANDRVATENFQQHAEHYLRMLGEAQREMDARREEQEKFNRERQAQRDRDRSDQNSGDDSAPIVDDADDFGSAPQPDFLGGMVLEDASSSLVETPEAAASESKAKPPRRPRRPAKPAEDKPSGDGGSDESSQAAE